ncbi:MAG: phosphoenolpyruvate--protein phosphotransferase [Anaerolineaceae bacterium]|nr:phosphoenolpyruvate--protein phosphotransferase [Anaerolineaceae bacterium]
MTEPFKGLGASRGLVYGPAWVYRPVEIDAEQILCEVPAEELVRLRDVTAKAKEQLHRLYEKALIDVGEGDAEIFQAHSMFLDDPELMKMIEEQIMMEKVNAEFAVQKSIESFAVTLEAMDNEYFQARAQDVRDVGRRLIYLLNGYDPESADLPKTPVVILAEDLTPSDTMQFDRRFILGLCTQKGGPTSHTAILSRSLGVPAAVSVPFELDKIENGTVIVLDGESGELIVSPTEVELEAVKERMRQLEKGWEKELAAAHEKACTLDGHEVEVVANIGSAEDARQAVAYGAEGVGLLRTEFLYLERDSSPSEADQIEVYREIAKEMGDLPIVVRTLDIGGDKAVSYLDLSEEFNPFLGWRAIRMISERPEVLHDQFRALLQGFAGSNLCIMLPLVSNIQEIRTAKAFYTEEIANLTAEGKTIAENVQFGIMVEVPSAAMMVEHFAEEVDFFSIGTNDLTQYTLAVDRTNERVASLASPFHPAVLKLIARTIREAHKKDRWVGLCGEMAGDPMATGILLGLGLDEFSMAAISIPTIKAKLRQLNLVECQKIAEKTLNMASTEDVLSYLATL